MSTRQDQDIPAKKLQALLDASNDMMRSVFRRDRKATLDTMARHIRRLLNVESCAIFLVADDAGDELTLESSSTDRHKGKLTKCPRIKVRSSPRGGLTGHIAQIGKIVRLTGRQLKANKYAANPGKPQSHLASGICYSVMGIPLKDREGRLLGLLKPENKKGPDGKPGSDVGFDEVDERFARILANKAVTIIECMKIEEEDRRSGVFFSSMVDRLDQSVFCKGRDGRFTYVNQRFAQRLGLSPADIVGKTDSDLYEPRFAKRFRRDDIEIMQTGKTKDVIETNPGRGGETRHVRVIKTPIRDASGDVIGVQGIFWDDTERYLLGTLLDSVPDNIYFKDRKSQFTRINKHLAEQFRLLDPNDAVGKTDHDFFKREHADAALRAERGIIKSGKPVTKLQEREQYADGRVRYVLTTKLPLRDSDGRIIGTFGISRDINELVRTQQLFRDLLSSLMMGNAVDTAKTLFAGLNRIFGYSSAMLYSYDIREGRLRGTAAYGLDEDAVFTRSHIVGSKPSHRKKPKSLAEAVFRKRAAVFVDDVTKPPANQQGRRVLHLKPGTSAIGLPLFSGKTLSARTLSGETLSGETPSGETPSDEPPLGVMLVYREDPKRPIGSHEEALLKPYADICALALSVAQAKESLSSRAKMLRTQAAIAWHFGRISVNPDVVLTASFGDIAQSARRDLTWIVKHAVKTLNADLGALFLADQPVCVKSTDAGDIDREYVRGTRTFTLRAMHKYPDNCLDHTCYSPGETALTASVLKHLKPRTSPDVQRESDWSRVDFGKLFPPLGLRTWMGIPIVFEHANRQYLFGAITFTRGRNSRTDKRAFGEVDERLAVALARLLALALQSLNVARMELIAEQKEKERQAVELRSRQEMAAIAVHNLQNPAAGVRVALGNIRDHLLEDKVIRKADREDMLESTDSALTQTEAILHTRTNFLAFIGSPRVEQMQRVDLQNLVEDALSQFKRNLFYFEPKPKPRSVELHPMALQTALTCLLQNAVEATQEVAEAKIIIGAHLKDGKGTLEVLDDGPGVVAPIIDRLFMAGTTTKGLGSGLGLYAAKTIMQRVGGDVVYDARYSSGARFIVRFLYREGDME